jgi:hypothetical protein
LFAKFNSRKCEHTGDADDQLQNLRGVAWEASRGSKTKAKLRLYIGGSVEAKLDEAAPTGRGSRVRSSLALTVPPM